MRHSKRIANRSRPVQVATRARHLLDLPREILIHILSFVVIQDPTSGIYVHDHLRLFVISLLRQVCVTFNDLLFSTPAFMSTIVLESVLSTTRYSRSFVFEKDEGSFMMYFKHIFCKNSIRTIILDYEKALTLPSVFYLLESCPNLEVLSLKEYSGFGPKDFLQYLKETGRKTTRSAGTPPLSWI